LKKNQKTLLRWGKTDYLVCTNSLGFKDSSNQKNVELAINKYRIVIIGDSLTEGLGYSFEKTFVGLVDKSVDKTRIEVLNAGVMSYSPKLYYLKTKYLLEELKLQFNELYVFIDISDIQDEVVYENFMSPSYLSLSEEIDVFLYNNSLTYHVGKQYLTIAHELRLKEERPKWTSDTTIFQKWGKRGLTLASNNMEELFLLCKQNGIKMTIAVYPWPYQIKMKDKDSLQVVFWKKFADEHGIDFLNYFPDFIQEPTIPEEVINKYFIEGDVHWNERGHKIIAQKIIAKICGNRSITDLSNL
jgi:hypothetical protein